MSSPGQTEEENAFSEDIAEEEEVEGTEKESEDSTPALKADGKPFTSADLRALQESLKKARKEARVAKAAVPVTPDGKTPEDAAAEATQAAEARYKPVVVRTAARAAFAEAGLVLPKGRADVAMSRALKLIDMAELEINEDGDVEGLDEQIEKLKTEFPELFASTRKPGRIDGAGRDGSGNAKPKSSADKIAALLS